jgi:hypothetical protein
MGLKIADLLRFRSEVTLTYPNTEKPILDDKGKPVVVYLRLIGDDDLEKSHKLARLSSSEIRAQLRDPATDLYRDRVAPIIDESRETCIEIIKSARASNLDAEARSAVERPNLPDIEEFAIDPDAPTLEEQEKLDAESEALEAKYQEDIKDYIAVKTNQIADELSQLSDEEISAQAAIEIVNITALAEFFNELMVQKIVRGAYTDKTYKEKAFDSFEEFRNSDKWIKDQLINGYLKLEIDPDQLKNL